MAEHLIIKGENKEERYATLLPQLKSLVEGESDMIANMANIAACSSASQSEIVVPIFKNDEVIAVLDIDSEYLNTFDAIDKKWLEQVADLFDSASIK